MLLDEYIRLAKTIDYLSEDQVRQIITPVADKLKQETGAMIVDIWLRSPGQDAIDILHNFIRRKEPHVPDTQDIALHDQATGLLAYVANKRRSVWVEELRPGLESTVNRLPPNEVIEGRFMNFYDKTLAFAAVPVIYQSNNSAILTIELAGISGIRDFHIDLLKAIAEPTGILLWKALFFTDIRKHADEAISGFRDSIARDSKILNPYRTGFIARPFDGRSESICKLIERKFQEKRVRATTYKNTLGTPAVVTEELLAQIASAHFGVADLTGLNDNVLMELGALLASNKQLLLIRASAEKDTKLPFNIAAYQVYLYEFVGEHAFVVDATGKRQPLQEFVDKFVERLSAENAFQGAKEWYGGG
jgi:hypothetical protein